MIYILATIPLFFACLIFALRLFSIDLSKQLTVAAVSASLVASLYFMSAGAFTGPLSCLLLCVFNFVFLAAGVYSFGYLEAHTDNQYFYVLFLALLSGINGILIADNLVLMYLFIELASVCTYVLVAFGGKNEQLEASLRYFLMGSIASIFIILGIALVYLSDNSLKAFYFSGVISNTHFSTHFLGAIFLLSGLMVKAAVVPFHSWLADAHSSAPSPVSAVLSGVIVKVLGLYVIMRVYLQIFGADVHLRSALLLFGSLSMVVGGYLAFRQTNIKRMLAYSTISQLGYIVCGFSLGTFLGITAAVLHMVNHAFFKSVLFLNAGAIEKATGTKDMEGLGGLSKELPVVWYSSFIGSMSLAGVPPFSGFWSKLLIIIALVQSKQYVVAFIAAIVSILTLSYVLNFIKKVFLGAPGVNSANPRRLPLSMRVPIAVLTIGCLLSPLLLIPKARAAVIDPAVKTALHFVALKGSK